MSAKSMSAKSPSFKSMFAQALLVATLASFSCAPAMAKDAFGSGSQDALNSLGATGTQSRLNYTTVSQSQHLGLGSSPLLQGAANVTVAAQGIEATVVQGVNTAGTVRVNNLANIEALLNIIANGMEILGIAWGGPRQLIRPHQVVSDFSSGFASAVGLIARPQESASHTSNLLQPGRSGC